MSAVVRAIEVLKAFSPQRPELTLVEVAAACELSKATALRLLTSLCEGGLLFRNPNTRSYRLTYEVLRLAEIAKAPIDLLTVARPLMRMARDRLQETALVAVRWGDDRINIEQIESLQPVRRVVAIGEPIPLYVSASSKVLLAGMSDADINEYLARTPLQQRSDTTAANAKQLWASIRAIRQNGYSVAVNEGGTDGAAVAAPIHDRSGATAGAFTVTAPVSRFNADLEARMVATVIEAAQAVSRDMGNTR